MSLYMFQESSYESISEPNTSKENETEPNTFRILELPEPSSNQATEITVNFL